MSCHHGMARPQVADGGNGLQIWRVVANIGTIGLLVAGVPSGTTWTPPPNIPILAANMLKKAFADSRKGEVLQIGGWAWG
jgi:hypothetical protein